MSLYRTEKYFEHVFEQLEKDSKEISEFEERISKEICEGRELMKHKSKNRKLIRSKRRLDE